MKTDLMNKKLKITKLTENIIALSILVLAFIIYLAVNSHYSKSVRDEKITYVTTSFAESDLYVYSKIDTILKDINVMTSIFSNTGSDSSFDDYVKLYKSDFSDLEFVGILRNSQLTKVYYPNGPIDVNKNELISNYDKLGTYDTQFGSDMDFFLNSNNEVCCITREPIYINDNGNKVYYGEVIFRMNFTKFIVKSFKPAMIDLANEYGWRAYLSFGYGSTDEVYKSIEGDIVNPIKFNSSNTDVYELKYEVSDKVLNAVDGTKYYRFIFALVIGLLLACSVKILLYTYRKIVDNNQMNDTKLDFFTNIVYEVRTSTNSIVGLCNEAEKEMAADKIKPYIYSSKNELNKLLRKINNLLDITNITEGKLKTWEEEYYIHMLINDLKNEYLPEAEAKEIKFLTETNEELPIKFKGPKIVLKKAIEHILDNALNVMFDGHIKINAYGEYKDDTRKEFNLKIVISDTELGIKQEAIKDVFSTKNLTNTDDESRVELAIASEMLKTIGGELKISSEYGKGSIYTITIVQKVIDERLMTNDMFEGLQEKFRDNLGKLRKVNAKVLVVDDNEVNLSVLKNIISLYGADVDSVKSGAAAIDLASTKNYDILFIDYLMPELDGIETLRKIRSLNKRYRTVPAVLVSANSESRDNDYQDGGFNEYLPKPISQNDIEKSLKTLLEIDLIECDEK